MPPAEYKTSVYFLIRDLPLIKYKSLCSLIFFVEDVCLSHFSLEPEDDTTASTIPNNNDDDDEVVTSFEVIPLEEKQCVKTICRNNYDKLFIGTKPPPDEVPIVVTQSCEDYKDKYIEEMKVKLHLRKLCWETMYGQELVKLTIMDTLFTLGKGPFINDITIFRDF